MFNRNTPSGNMDPHSNSSLSTCYDEEIISITRSEDWNQLDDDKLSGLSSSAYSFPGFQERIDLINEKPLHDPSELIELGFNTDDIIKILKKCGKNTIEVIFKHHGALINYGFDKEGILRLACHEGGGSNIQAVIHHFPELNLFYNHAEILQMAGHKGGSRCIEAFFEYRERMQLDLKFNLGEILQIVGRERGAVKLKAVSDHYEDLVSQCRLPRSTIVQMVIQPNGASNIAAILAKFKNKPSSQASASEEYALQRNRLAKLEALKLAFGTGSLVTSLDENVVFLLENKLKFTHPQALRILKTCNNACVSALEKHHQPLINWGFTNEMITTIAGHKGGAVSLSQVVSHYDTLRNTFRYTLAQIEKLASQCGSANNIGVVCEHTTTLLDYPFTRQQIINMASHHGAAKYIKILVDYLPRLKSKGILPSTIETFHKKPGKKDINQLLIRVSAIVSPAQDESILTEPTTTGKTVTEADDAVPVQSISNQHGFFKPLNEGCLSLNANDGPCLPRIDTLISIVNQKRTISEPIFFELNSNKSPRQNQYDMPGRNGSQGFSST